MVHASPKHIAEVKAYGRNYAHRSSKQWQRRKVYIYIADFCDIHAKITLVPSPPAFDRLQYVKMQAIKNWRYIEGLGTRLCEDTDL